MWSFKKNKGNLPLKDNEYKWVVIEAKTNDDEPMLVRINQTAKKWAANNTFDIRVGFAIPLNEVVPNGYPSASENKVLSVIETQIYELVKAKSVGLHVLTITTGRFKEIIFYFNNADEIEKIHNKINAKIKSHNIQCYGEIDTDWNVYFSFLNRD